MAPAPGVLDLGLLLALCAVAPALDARWLYPRFLRAVAAHRPGARPRWYALVIGMAWAFTAAVLAIWAVERRPWAALYLRPARPLGVWLGLGLSVLYVGLMWVQIRALLARPDGRARLGRQLAGAGAMLPRTPGERWGFALVSLTAGICEEVLFRGFVMWCCAAWVGPIGAVLLSSLLFGVGHVYLGVSHIVRTGLVGLAMAGIVIAAGSLWPAILLHTVIDLVAGEIGYRALSDWGAAVPA
jgi:uncharacterized protein